MTRLILTTNDSGAGNLMAARIANMVIPFGPELVCGPLPTDAQLADLLAGHSERDAEWPRWFDVVGERERRAIASKGIGFFEFCAQYDTVELWADPTPHGQLILIWLLSCFRAHPEATFKLSLVQANVRLGEKGPEHIARWVPAAVTVTADHLEIASLAWAAWRSPTPEAWFDLLEQDLSSLPQLRRSVLALLEELPWAGSGVGATERRILDLIDQTCTNAHDVFTSLHRDERRVFDYWAMGALLDGLAHCPAPAVLGLPEGPFTMEMHDDRARRQRYFQSKLTLSPLGEAVLAVRDDFARRNPIHRWWGGTELTSDRLWRWDPARGAPVAP